ncbi:hypothetical protein HYPSUDRAFT_42386 [Hypholoma sublateritium FD-334 SS-4]|uniref:Phosphoglycerate mutase (2,3-diphosphoglycerate-dependent) n=1 Tax=Hypholoma sublateritium (strain FD-334 SS-4) TaxID=945553 RepID=A0A0D2L3B8_HYPSF|nr:hypothetical protein HYPSUDRAFT_42386 [Hypholoma sublateritium FD-334 SS-4]
MVTFIFIRHGESKDNLRGVWAGWKDSPLSNHGMLQAEALGDSLASMKLSFMYSSDLLRAKTTANAVKRKQRGNPNLLLREFTILREQNFGAGEGMKFSKKKPGMSLTDHYSKGKFPALYTRHERFPEGESLDDLAQRADTVINDILFPHLLEEKEEDVTRTIAVVSHGLFIGELLAAILRRSHERDATFNHHHFRGMKNTAWTEVAVSLKHSNTASATSPLVVKVGEINQDTHLLNLRRQKGGIGSMAHDPSQVDIRTLFEKKSVASKATRLKPY